MKIIPAVKLYISILSTLPKDIYLKRTDIMEQHTLKNVNNCLNTNIYSYLETSGGQNSNPYLNVVHFFNTRANQKSVAA